ncbi:MAG: STAS domain-containing protein [Acidobacteriia bacterium]|nr:STAS domain-containing protein [Terriglobia bacterium]
MPLSVDSRRAGDLVILTCRGRLVEGAESSMLQKYLDEAIARCPRVVLHMGGVDFMDSSGLGLLARYLIRVRNAHGNLKLCAVSAKFDEVLRTTKLRSIFETYASEADAIAAFDQPAAAPSTPRGL